jgi:ATP-dependent Clp endopeptidase proteolytic subunit ClpP
MPGAKQWFSVKNEGDMPEISINGYVGDGENINYQLFIDTLKNLKSGGARGCVMNINCGGGDMFHGFAIYDAARASGLDIDCRVVGMAASMGSILMLMGNKKPSIAKNAFVMIHKPQGGEYGEADSLRSMADLMDKMEKRITALYASTTGKPEDEITKWLKAGTPTWFSADEAVEAGLCREISGEVAGAVPTNIKSMQPKEAYNIFNKLLFEKPKPITDMELPVVTLKQLGLKGDTQPDAETLAAAIGNLSKKAKAYDVLQAEVEEAKEERAAKLVENAIKEKRILPAVKDKMIALAKDDFEFAEQMIKGKTPAKTIGSQVSETEPENILEQEREKFKLPADMQGKTFKELEKAKGGPALLKRMKKEAPALFKQMQIDDYGKVVFPA